MFGPGRGTLAARPAEGNAPGGRTERGESARVWRNLSEIASNFRKGRIHASCQPFRRDLGYARPYLPVSPCRCRRQALHGEGRNLGRDCSRNVARPRGRRILSLASRHANRPPSCLPNPHRPPASGRGPACFPWMAMPASHRGHPPQPRSCSHDSPPVQPRRTGRLAALIRLLLAPSPLLPPPHPLPSHAWRLLRVGVLFRMWLSHLLRLCHVCHLRPRPRIHRAARRHNVGTGDGAGSHAPRHADEARQLSRGKDGMRAAGKAPGAPPVNRGRGRAWRSSLRDRGRTLPSSASATFRRRRGA